MALECDLALVPARSIPFRGWHISCSQKQLMRSKAAFTLVEIMIVVAIIALLAVVAVPGFLRARQRTQSTHFINSLRLARDAFDTFAVEHQTYPPDANRGIVPPGMDRYFGKNLNWEKPTAIGGNWDWEYGVFGLTAGISVASPSVSEEQLRGIDQQIDDGNLATGDFRDQGPGRYTLILLP